LLESEREELENNVEKIALVANNLPIMFKIGN